MSEDKSRKVKNWNSGKFNKNNLENNYKDYYKIAQTSDDLVKQDFYIMRVFHNDFISKAHISDLWGSIKFDFSFSEDNDKNNLVLSNIDDESEEKCLLFNEKFTLIINNFQEKLFHPSVQYLLLLLLMNNKLDYLNNENNNIVKDDIELLKENIKKNIFDKGKQLSYLSRALGTIIRDLNKDLSKTEYDNISRLVRKLVKEHYEEI